MGVPWQTCTEFKVIKKAPSEEPRSGVAMAIKSARSNGESLLLSTALNAVGFRADAAPRVEMTDSFTAVKDLVATTKDQMATKLGGLFPGYVKPLDPLKIEDNDVQVPPVLVFNKTKIAAPNNGSKGVLFNDAKLAIFYSRTDPDKLGALFSGGAVVASEIGPERSHMNSKLSGEMHVIQTNQTYIPNIGLLKGETVFAPTHMLTLPGATLKVPFCMLAAPFGVNERTTAELLMTNIIPYANMIVAPAKAKIYTRKYDDPAYIQDVYIETQNQVTIDVLTTFRNVALRLSPDTVVKMFGGATHSVAVPMSGESLIDMIGTDHKPTVGTLTTGGVVSLRETAVLLKDETLEFYGVVPNAFKIAQADGHVECGTNPIVGDAAFLKIGGEKIEGCATMLKNGELGVFAVRVTAKTKARWCDIVIKEQASASASVASEDKDDSEEEEEEEEEVEQPPPKKAKQDKKASKKGK